MDLGEAKEVYKVRIVTGAGSADKWIKYHLEYSEDGNSWTSKSAQTGTANGTDTYEEDLKGASARYIKLVNNEDRHNWIKFNEFSVCGKEAEVTGDVMDYTNTNDENWKVTYGDEVSKVYARDNVTLKAGQYIGLKLDRIHAIASIDTEGNGTDKLTLQTSLNQKEWTDSTSAKSARYIRLINNGSTDVTFSLSKFEVTNDEIGAMDLFETNIGGASNSEDARKLGTTANWMDGDLTSKAKYCATPAKDDYITYTLGQEITLKSLKVYVLDTAIDYPRDAVIQASVDNKTWTDLIKIGDGIENDGTDRDTKPAENGWTHDTVDVAYSYVENANINNVKAKYIRLYFNAGYSARWVELNEIQINGGAYIPTVNDPTFETDAALQRGQEPWNLNDGDLTTAFVPDMTDKTEGSLVYHLSDATNVRKLNIVQKSISNATVSVRIDENNWVTLGTLNKSLTTFYTYMYDQVLDVKLTWGDVKPAICEIITLQVPKQTDDELKQEVEQNLSAAIASAESIYTAGNVDKTYTDASWSAFETAYKNATTVDKTTATANEIQTLTSALQDAKKNLKNVAMEEAEKALAAADMDRIFFTNSGTEAIEGALKAAKKYAYSRDGHAGHEVIAMQHSFHGRSLGALSVTGTKHYQEPFEPLIPGIRFAEYNNLESVKAQITDKTCAIIMETVQGEGGIYPADPEFLKGVRALCDEKDILLILDEIQCGMGRTGAMFAWQNYGVKPDIMTVAKALGCGVPVGAFLMTQKVADKSLAPGDHGTTYGGNPFVGAAVSTVFDIFEKDQIINHVHEITPYLVQKLDELAAKYDFITDRRGMGLMQGLEMEIPVGQVAAKALEKGLIIITAGSNVVRFVPPLIIEKEHVDEMVTKLDEVLATF